MPETDEVAIPVKVEGADEAMRKLEEAQQATEETRQAAEQGGGALAGGGVGAAVGGFAGAAIGTVASQTGLAQVGGGILEALVGKLIVTFEDEIRAVIGFFSREVVPVLKDIASAVGGATESASDLVDSARRAAPGTTTGNQKVSMRDILALGGLGAASGGAAGAGVGFLAGGPQGSLVGGALGGLIGGAGGLAVGGTKRLGQEVQEGFGKEFGQRRFQPATDSAEIEALSIMGGRGGTVSDPDAGVSSGAMARNTTAPGGAGVP